MTEPKRIPFQRIISVAKRRLDIWRFGDLEKWDGLFSFGGDLRSSVVLFKLCTCVMATMAWGKLLNDDFEGFSLSIMYVYI